MSPAAAPLAWPPRREAPAEAPPESPAEELARKQQRREAKLLAEASRALDPWERYRALVDTVEEGLDLAEMADRKVRFALVVLAGLNVGVFALTSRPEVLGVAGLPVRGWLGLYLLAYALVGVYFFLQAVEALRPRSGGPVSESALVPAFRDPEAVLRFDLASYERAWREVRFEGLNAALARRSHHLAGINREKFAALGRLYAGLRVLAVLFGGLVVLLCLSAFSGGARP